jgi:hypothetical protein
MSTITYEIARTRSAQAVAKTAPKRLGLVARFYARMIEARRETAMREFRRHAHLLPNELEQAGWKVNERSEDSLPFVR